MRGYVERNRALLESLILAAVLPGVAGAVNATSLFAVGTYTSHVTGSISRIGDELAQGKTDAALGAAGLVLLFFLGVVTATVLVELSARRKKARYASALLVEAGTLYAFLVLSHFVSPSTEFNAGVFVLAALLCFGMGMQNALVTRISGAVVRTTHLTGVVTDLGIEMVRLLWPSQDPSAPPRKSSVRKLGVLFTIFTSFLSGAIVGPVLYFQFGTLSMMVPASVLLCLIVFDTLLGLGTVNPLAPTSGPHPLPAPEVLLEEARRDLLGRLREPERTAKPGERDAGEASPVHKATDGTDGSGR